MVSAKSSAARSTGTAVVERVRGGGHPARTRRWLSIPAVQRVLSVLVLLAVWQLIGSHFPYSMSSPGAIARGADRSLVSQILPAFGQTLETFGIGFAISVLAGVPIGL